MKINFDEKNYTFQLVISLQSRPLGPRLFVELRPRELLVCGARRGVAFFSKSSRQLRLILLVFITSRPVC